MSVLPKEIPQDWYETAFADTADMAWTDRTEPEINRALNMLRPVEGARVLDLACGSGRHSLELRRRGFEVVGADISPELLEIARRDADEQDLEVEFVGGDMRSSSSTPGSTSSSASTTGRSATSRPTRRTCAASRSSPGPSSPAAST